ncbi:hypothetical protein [uncultured Nitrospira sp.]|uniref:hypothetical protein n=1 Tax=uncultured Nitrospira sp. TaxID=157176 RepID=UPI00314063C9
MILIKLTLLCLTPDNTLGGEYEPVNPIFPYLERLPANAGEALNPCRDSSLKGDALQQRFK